MILKGNQRAQGRELALHLLNTEDNEHAVIHELRGFLADDLIGAFQEAEAISFGTKCLQYLFSLSLNPPPDKDVPVAVFEETIDRVEQKLGLAGQSRAIVFHEKKGRRHAHAVWSRIDVAQMKAVNLPLFKRRLQEMAREIYREHGWDMPAGFERKDERDRDTFVQVEAAQAKSAQKDPKALKKMFREVWERSDSLSAFGAALRENGFELALGSRRAFVAVDAEGKAYSLSRWTGAGAKALRARFGAPDSLPSIEEARQRLTPTDQSPPRADDALKEMVARHRAERAALMETQRQAREQAGHHRQERLPCGLKASWAKLTGQYQSLIAEFEAEATQENEEQRRALDDLIAQQLRERQTYRTKAEHRQAFDYLFAQATPRKDHRQHLVLPDDDPLPSQLAVEFKPELILDHISQKQAVFAQDDIDRVLRAISSDAIWRQSIAKRLAASSDLISLSSDRRPRFTTRDFQSAERSVFDTSARLTRDNSFAVKQAHVARAVAQKNGQLRQVSACLSDEQCLAIHHLTDGSALSCVVGLAGAGKSTILDVARLAWEAQGHTVHGAALAGKAADGLQAASAIPSRTLASLEAGWQSGYEPIPPKSILVIDEVGMVGTRQLSRIMAELEKRQCKLVLVGDPDQLQPIEAGTPFRDLLAMQDHTCLSDVRRQKQGWQREATRYLAAGNIDAALKSYSDRGHVDTARTTEQAVARLAEAYMACDDAPGSQLALAHRRRDVFALNQAIRQMRLKAGALSGETLVDSDHGPRAFSQGDRIVFTRNDKTLSVRNGMLGTVEALDRTTLQVALDDSNKHVTIDTRAYRALDHGYAVSIHKSQGCTVDRAFVLGNKTMDHHLTYVAMTRHKETLHVCSTPGFGMERYKEIRTKAATWSQGPKRIR